MCCGCLNWCAHLVLFSDKGAPYASSTPSRSFGTPFHKFFPWTLRTASSATDYIAGMGLDKAICPLSGFLLFHRIFHDAPLGRSSSVGAGVDLQQQRLTQTLGKAPTMSLAQVRREVAEQQQREQREREYQRELEDEEKLSRSEKRERKRKRRKEQEEDEEVGQRKVMQPPH